QSKDAGARLARAEERVGLPRPELGRRLGRRGARADRALAGEPAATVVAAVAFAPLFAGAAQMLIERAARAFVGPDVAVDRLVADGELAVAPQPAGHLLRTPIVPQSPLDAPPMSGRGVAAA